MMEGCSAAIAFENLPEGSATVGFEVCVKHVAAAAEGATCRVRSVLREVVEEITRERRAAEGRQRASVADIAPVLGKIMGF